MEMFFSPLVLLFIMNKYLQHMYLEHVSCAGAVAALVNLLEQSLASRRLTLVNGEHVQCMYEVHTWNTYILSRCRVLKLNLCSSLIFFCLFVLFHMAICAEIKFK